MKLSLTLLAASAAASVIVACATEGDRSAFQPEPAPPSNFTATDGSLGSVDAGDGGEPCLTDTLKAQPVPLAMLLVMDRSGSMAGTKWDQARNAMIGFADTPGAAGSKLGLTVFPPDPGAGDQCTPASYKPIVPIALLPGNGTMIKDALLSRSTTGSTPMANGLQGGIDSMKDHLGQNPNEEGVIILVTDGDPGACSSVDTVANVASIASTAAKGTPSIRTFVVGMDGATFSNLDTIAKAGEGAPSAFNAAGTGGDAGVNAQQLLLDALEKIRSGALGCEYILPTPGGDKGVLDPNSVEIKFTPGGNDPPQSFKRVDSAEQCGTKTGGFYYDDPKEPKRIILCPASCTDVKGGTSTAKVDVFLGCIKPVN